MRCFGNTGNSHHHICLHLVEIHSITKKSSNGDENNTEFIKKYHEFQVPVSYRTVHAQAPFLKHEMAVAGVTVTAPSDDETDQDQLFVSGAGRRKPRAITLDETRLDNALAKSPGLRKRAETLNEFELTAHRKSVPGQWPLLPLPDSSLTENEIRQKKINATMMAALAQKHEGPAPVIRKDSYLGLGDSQSSINYQSDDGSDISVASYASGEAQTYESSSIGGERRRVSQTRMTSRAEHAKTSYRRAGMISFSTQYIESEHILKVHIMQLHNIASKRNASDVNPFVRVYLEPGKKQKQNTKYQKQTKSPIVNETLVFNDLNVDGLGKYKMKIKVYDHGTIKKNELLGEVDVALSSLNIQQKETFDVDLFIRRSETTLASLSVTLCHEATFSKLEVIIQEAKNLSRKNSAVNPYATVWLFKEGITDKKETTTKRKTKNPVFNESLDFDVITNNTTPLYLFSLAVTLFNHNLIGKDDVLGHVIFSLTSPQQSAAEQWLDVQREPHKRITRWHNLLAADEV